MGVVQPVVLGSPNWPQLCLGQNFEFLVLKQFSHNVTDSNIFSPQLCPVTKKNHLKQKIKFINMYRPSFCSFFTTLDNSWGKINKNIRPSTPLSTAMKLFHWSQLKSLSSHCNILCGFIKLVQVRKNMHTRENINTYQSFCVNSAKLLFPSTDDRSNSQQRFSIDHYNKHRFTF